MSTQRSITTGHLPDLAAAAGRWRLPLADHVACELAHICVDGPSAGGAAPLAELMSIDPAFTLWSACVAGRGGADPPRSVADLARWIAPRSLTVLRWPEEENAATAGDATEPARRGVRGRWRDLSVNAVAVANLAAASVEDDERAAEAFLFGLVHNALDWLRTCGPRVVIAAAADSCLPHWLVQLLRQRGRSPRSEAARSVSRAVRTWRDGGRRESRVAETDLSDVRRVRKWWQPAAPPAPRPIATLLPTLLPRLARLQQLEHTFGEQLEQEKLASLGELAYGASHEINNPLANISTRAQSLLRDETEPERRRSLAIMVTQAFRANEMIADMMLFARPPDPQREAVDLVDLVDALIVELAEEAEQQGTRLRRVSPDAQVVASVDPTQLAAALRAICVNALEALGGRGRVDVKVEPWTARADWPGRWARIAVEDTGPGISRAVRRHMFDPFFSGREAGRGLGLGLSKCWRIVTRHGGHLQVASEPGSGTEISVFLPLETDLPESPRGPAPR